MRHRPETGEGVVRRGGTSGTNPSWARETGRGGESERDEREEYAVGGIEHGVIEVRWNSGRKGRGPTAWSMLR